MSPFEEKAPAAIALAGQRAQKWREFGDALRAVPVLDPPGKLNVPDESGDPTAIDLLPMELAGVYTEARRGLVVLAALADSAVAAAERAAQYLREDLDAARAEVGS